VSTPGARIGVLGVIAAGAAAVAWAGTVPITQEGPMDAVRAPASRAPAPRLDAADSLVANALRRPLFRPARRRAAIGFDPSRSAQAASSESAPAPAERPTLALSGIVWGAEPAAIVEGIPGTEGSTVLRRGDASSGIRVTRIDRLRVVLVGRDTSWVLEVREPWR
jgi:hypothetical protein